MSYQPVQTKIFDSSSSKPRISSFAPQLFSVAAGSYAANAQFGADKVIAVTATWDGINGVFTAGNPATTSGSFFMNNEFCEVQMNLPITAIDVPSSSSGNAGTDELRLRINELPITTGISGGANNYPSGLRFLPVNSNASFDPTVSVEILNAGGSANIIWEDVADIAPYKVYGRLLADGSIALVFQPYNVVADPLTTNIYPLTVAHIPAATELRVSVQGRWILDPAGMRQ